MITAQLNINPETGKELTQFPEEKNSKANRANHRSER